MRVILGLLISLFLISCGGDTLPQYSRTDKVLTGFYFSDSAQVSETSSFTDFHWEAFIEGEEQGFKNIQAAQKITIIDVMSYVYQRTPEGKFLLKSDAKKNLSELRARLTVASILPLIKYITPMDEPDINVLSISDIHTANLIVKEVFPEVGLAMVFAGIERLYYIGDADLVGFDLYGEDIFKQGLFQKSVYDRFMERVSPHQRVMLFPGGGNPWKEDPIPFLIKASEDGRILMIVGFLWIDRNDSVSMEQGIRTNGMASVYRDAYMKGRY